MHTGVHDEPASDHENDFFHNLTLFEDQVTLNAMNPSVFLGKRRDERVLGVLEKWKSEHNATDEFQGELALQRRRKPLEEVGIHRHLVLLAK